MSFTFYARWDALNNWSRIIDFGNGADNNNIVIANEDTSNNFVWEVWNNNSRRRAVVQNGIEIGVWTH